MRALTLVPEAQRIGRLSPASCQSCHRRKSGSLPTRHDIWDKLFCASGMNVP